MARKFFKNCQYFVANSPKMDNFKLTFSRGAYRHTRHHEFGNKGQNFSRAPRAREYTFLFLQLVHLLLKIFLSFANQNYRFVRLFLTPPSPKQNSILQ